MADDESEGAGEAAVVWEGDCLDVVRKFPKPIREDLGADIRRMQLGERPLSSRPTTSIGARVFELRQMDDKGWYRVIYLGKVGSRLHTAACIYEEIGEDESERLRIAGARLKVVNARLLEEKKNARKTK